MYSFAACFRSAHLPNFPVRTEPAYSPGPQKNLPRPANRMPQPIYLRFRGSFAGPNHIPPRRRATRFPFPFSTFLAAGDHQPRLQPPCGAACEAPDATPTADPTAEATRSASGASGRTTRGSAGPGSGPTAACRRRRASASVRRGSTTVGTAVPRPLPPRSPPRRDLPTSGAPLSTRAFSP